MKAIGGFLLKMIVPRGCRTQILKTLDGYEGPVSWYVWEALVLTLGAYRVQYGRAFNTWAFVLQIPLICYCYYGAGLSWGLLLAHASVLSALTLRDAFTFRQKLNGTWIQYCHESAADAAVAGVFMLAAHALTLNISRELALPNPVLYRGALVLLPMTAVMRMMLRPKPAFPVTFKKDLKPEKVYSRAWYLNLLWVGSFNGLLMMSASDRVGSIADFFFGALPYVTLRVWMGVQRNTLQRGDEVETLLENWKHKVLKRKKEKLLYGMEKREPMYNWYVACEILLLVQALRAVVIVLRPWFSSVPQPMGFFQPAVAMFGFATAVLTWQFVKSSNKAAADVLEAAVEQG